MSDLATVRRAPRRKERPEPERRTVVRRDVEGKDLAEVTLEPAVFGIEPNTAVLHQVVTAQLAAARAGTQSTRTRGEVRGGGAKPYRQKGTGRARQGSTRAAQWVGGGVAMGPKPRSHRQRTPKKMVRLALCSALSDRAAEERVALVDRFGWEEPRTKSAVAALDALGLEGRVLVVLGPDDVVAERSFGNLPEIQTTLVAELSAYDVLRNDWVLFTDESLLVASGIEVLEAIEIEVDEETGEADITVVEELVDTNTGEVVEVEVEATVDLDELAEAEAEAVAEDTDTDTDTDAVDDEADAGVETSEEADTETESPAEDATDDGEEA